MKILSKNKLAIFAAVLLTGAAYANKANTNMGNHASGAVNHSMKNLSYTAHGKTDRRTAMLFQQLLKQQKNHNLQVHVDVTKRAARSSNKNFTYTITGKTSIRNVKKLMQLFKTNKHVEIVAQANPVSNQSSSHQQGAYAKQQQFQQRLQQRQLQKQWGFNQLPAPYQPFSYVGKPPVFIQGNILWYPMPITKAPQKIAKQAPYQVDYSALLANK